MRILSACRLPAVLLLAAACTDPVSPDGLQGTYVLRTVAGEPLPRVAWSTELDGTATILADTIRLDGRGGASRRTVVHRTANQWMPETTYDAQRRLEYAVSGARIEIGWLAPCDDTAACVANEVGVIGDGGIRLELRMQGTVDEGVFERIAP